MARVANREPKDSVVIRFVVIVTASLVTPSFARLIRTMQGQILGWIRACTL